MKHNEPEFASIEGFVEFCMDDERVTFAPGEAQKVAENNGRSVSSVIEELKGYGLTVELKRKAEGRGFTANDHDKFAEKNGWRSGCGIGNASRHMVSGWQPK